MLGNWIIKMFIALGFISEALAAFGDLRINGGGRSGRLEFRRTTGWISVCRDGFDDYAAEIACNQLGYVQSSNVFTYDYYYYYNEAVCDVDCYGYEDELEDCYFNYCDSCANEGGTVGITCTLTPSEIAGVVVGVLAFIGLATTCCIVCICCLIPSCPCYYNRRSRITSTTVVAQPAPQIITATTTTSARATNYQPPPVYDTGYQPYPAGPHNATTSKY